MSVQTRIKSPTITRHTRTFPLEPEHWLPKALPELASVGFPFSPATIDDTVTIKPEIRTLETTVAMPFGFHFRVLPELDESMEVATVVYDYITQTATMAPLNTQKCKTCATTYEQACKKSVPTGPNKTWTQEWVMDCFSD